MKNKTHYLWKEKYRSETLENYICGNELRIKIQGWIDKQDFPHLLLHGSTGTGKTTLAKLLVKNINCEYLYINATDERSMDTMRDKVKAFASTMSFKPIKVIILDEADFIRVDSQALLRNMIEEFSLTTRFILTGNYVDRFIDPLQSRLHKIKLEPPSRKDVALWVNNILEKEEIKFSLESIVFYVNLYYPDVRKIIDEVQHNSGTGELVTNEKALIESNYMFQVLEALEKFLKKPDGGQTFSKIRQIIADSGHKSFDELYRFLYDNLFKKDASYQEEIIIILAEMEYQSSFCLDKEINIMATIAKILNIYNKK